MPQLPIALQLYTLRRVTHGDLAAIIRQVAEIGYDGVEFAGYGGLSAEEMRSLLAETRLRPAGSHIGFDALQHQLDQEIEYCRSIACPNLILAGAPKQYRTNVAEMAPFLNDCGRRCHEADISFGYHNHEFEFAPIDGRPALELLMERTNPDHVTFELDVYWAAYAGFDPHRFLREHVGRIQLLHLKDMAEDRSFTEVGEGTLDLKRLYADADGSGVRWAIVEHDEPTIPPLESALISLCNLQSM